jgi:hypothetical protein
MRLRGSYDADHRRLAVLAWARKGPGPDPDERSAEQCACCVGDNVA